MAEQKQPKSGSISGEVGFALITFAIMIGAILGADKLEQSGLVSADCAFIMKQFGTYIARLSLVLLTVWVYVHIGFPRTIGRDFKHRFEKGWDEMADADAVKWMVIMFIGLFLGACLLML